MAQFLAVKPRIFYFCFSGRLPGCQLLFLNQVGRDRFFFRCKAAEERVLELEEQKTMAESASQEERKSKIQELLLIQQQDAKITELQDALLHTQTELHALENKVLAL